MAHQQSYAPAYGQPAPIPPEPPRNARGETPVETERRWLSNIAAVFLPFMLAGKLLKPKYRTGRPDPLMERVIRLRAWLGLAVVLTVFLRVFYDKKKQAVPGTGIPGTGVPGAGTPTVPGMPTNIPRMPTNFPTSLPSGFPSVPGVPRSGTGAAGALDGVPGALPQATSMPSIPSVPTPGAGGATQKIADMESTSRDVQAVIYELAGAVVHRIILAPILCALGLVILGLLLVAMSRPHVRDQTIRQLSHPIRVILLFALIPAAAAGAYLGLRKAAGLEGKGYPLNTDGSTLQLVCSWGAAYLGMWAMFFSLGALWQITRHLFAAIDGHPLLPALLAMWLAWTMTVNDLTLKVGDGMLGKIAPEDNTVPDSVKAAVAILGCTVITVLSLWEIARVGKWNGVNFRSGPFGNQA